MCGLALDYGEYFSVTDEYLGAQKMILGSEVAAALFPEGNYDSPYRMASDL